MFSYPNHIKGPKHQIENYIGIAKLSAIPKIFEKIVKDKIYVLISQRMSTHQHGFLAGKSTITSPFSFDYVVGSEILEKVTEINDLGVVFDRKFAFKSHIDYIVSKANISLGFVKHYAREFKVHYIYKILFTSFVTFT